MVVERKKESEKKERTKMKMKQKTKETPLLLLLDVGAEVLASPRAATDFVVRR